MNLGIYTVRDEPSQAFMALQVHDNDELAIRSFDFAMSSNEMMKFRPEDFSLWYVGDYDSTTGIIEGRAPKILKRGEKRGRKANSKL